MTDTSFKEVESRMHKCVEATRHEFASIRTGRAAPALLDRLVVEAYGQPVPLKQVAGVSTPDSRTLLITAWDKGVVPAIKKGIEKSELGLTPAVDGSAIRLIIPPLSEERRKDLAKLIKKKAEDGRVAVRNVRHKAHDELRGQLKSHDITEDDNKRMQESLQRLTDKYVKEIDALVVAKEKEIMEV
ncbi:MAG: ribosome recycling factor [Candidatus Eremiobacteraeota bacterium]|nr:ribosome recycling factor [Candidatus Eremiobacteraeota bacterium]MBV8499237.1 ribosome recycling factor [Candidatus Eremiobacteraeota bacterium]